MTDPGARIDIDIGCTCRLLLLYIIYNIVGIFVGNSAVDKPLRERPWAFNDNWTKAAKLSGICALKTEDLYVVHLLKARGIISMDEFWQDLFETNGVLDMKKYLEMLAPKEHTETKGSPTR